MSDSECWEGWPFAIASIQDLACRLSKSPKSYFSAGQKAAAVSEFHDAINVLESDVVDVRMDKLQASIDKAIVLIDNHKPKDALAKLKRASYLELFDTTLFDVPAQGKASH